MLAVLAFAGCEEESPRHSAAKDTKSNAEAEHRQAWLAPSSKLTAAQWMASREAAEALNPSDPAVQEIAADLAAANRLYRESERMIANRSVQLEGMLKDIGVSERAEAILDDLTRVAGEAGQTEGFGAVSQHYFNLRSSNVSRGEALATLKARFGMRQ